MTLIPFKKPERAVLGTRPGSLPPPPATRSRELDERGEDELMLLAAAGSRQAFETLVARHMSRLASFCAKWTGDPAAGEELAQDVWLEIWKQRQGYRSEGKFLAWLYTSARNRCKNHQRWRKRRGQSVTESESTELDRLASAEPSTLDRAIEEERQARVRRSVAHLGEKHREALLLRFAEGLEYEDIARVVDAKSGTVRARVFHGIKLLRALLEKDWP